jgi:hypothetical protein
VDEKAIEAANFPNSGVQAFTFLGGRICHYSREGSKQVTNLAFRMVFFASGIAFYYFCILIGTQKVHGKHKLPLRLPNYHAEPGQLEQSAWELYLASLTETVMQTTTE